ncbi:MAG: adenine nucleotide alpha hydrolase [Gemmatimonadaceae bacterium]|nr:adenine nucleotide alpha hydrolase [Gemmatimonadaceae bacterium]
MTVSQAISAVEEWLALHEDVAIAVSGGIDSLTLATIATRHHPHVEVFHALSPAVPVEDTARVRAFASTHDWRLHEIDAGEFTREEYVANPVNRCFFCKQSLYASIAAIASRTSAQIVSGTNRDDLAEYRPGLEAAQQYGVRHPFVEVGITKRLIREMATVLGFGALASLPSSPCLSSRIETGIPISAPMLEEVHAAETAVRSMLPSTTVIRCRVRSSGVVIEVSEETLSQLSMDARQAILHAVRQVFVRRDPVPDIQLEKYRTGSAFLVTTHA